jgi:putative membrane protein
MRLPATVSSMVLLLAAPAWAQSGNPAGMTPGTGPQQPNNADRLFVRGAALGGMAEIELGKLAKQKAQSAAVVDFAALMVEDHSNANERLIGLAGEDGIAVPDMLDPKHEAAMQELEDMSGVAFDQAYIRGQVADHQKAAQLLEYEIASGQDVDLKKFASDILPTVLQHLRVAQDLQSEITGSAP